MPILHRVLRAAIALAVAAAIAAGQSATTPPDGELAPCDEALLAPGRHAVFVRMRDQVFRRGGDYEEFCDRHETTPRSRVRAEVLADLRARSDATWTEIDAAIDDMVATGALSDPQRYWIVNGLAADASAAAVERLRRLPQVAFVHRQTQRGRPQHRTARRPQDWLQQRAKDEQAALAMLADRGEESPFDPDGVTVPWNLEAVAAPAAWRLGADGNGVTVALLDTGVLVTEPLVHALWQNPGERPNGKDDDGNGFVDDLFGWDFGGDTRFAVGDGPKSHGTMCGGIVAGRPWGQPRTVTGVAPRSRLMVLRGMGSLRAYEYAASMGADVLSMSYMWIGVELGSYRGVFRTAHEHLAACGIVAVGGAGNFGKSAPEGRQIALPKDIPCVIAASGIGRDGKAPAFSSRGPCRWDDVPFFSDYPASAPLQKPDVTGCAADFPVWHRTQMRGRRLRILWQDDHGYGLVQGPRGNSFSGPHAAGVAALVLSVQPELTPWRVQSILASTCSDRGAAGWDPVYGAGLLQADAAVTAARAATIDG